MASDFGAFGMVIIGTGMNAAKDVKKGHDPFPTLLAGGMLAFFVSLIASYLDARLGTALAGLFLFGSFLTSGVEVFSSASAAVASKKG